MSQDYPPFEAVLYILLKNGHLLIFYVQSVSVSMSDKSRDGDHIPVTG